MGGCSIPYLGDIGFHRGHREVRFLGKSASENIARLIKSKEELARLDVLGLGYHIIEKFLLRYGLHYSYNRSDTTQKTPPECWNRDRWLVYRDPGFDRTLSVFTKAALKPSELLPICQRLVLRDEQSFMLDASKLQYNTAYQSKPHAVSMGEFFSFHTDTSGKK
jgi:hypothetical protein